MENYNGMFLAIMIINKKLDKLLKKLEMINGGK